MFTSHKPVLSAVWASEWDQSCPETHGVCAKQTGVLVWNKDQSSLKCCKMGNFSLRLLSLLNFLFIFCIFFSSFGCNPVGSCCDDMVGIHFQRWSICSRSGRFCLWIFLTAQSLLQIVLLLGDRGFNSSSFWHISLLISLIAKGPLLCYLTTECQFKCL